MGLNDTNAPESRGGARCRRDAVPRGRVWAGPFEEGYELYCAQVTRNNNKREARGEPKGLYYP